jgi:hypothetical protein
MHLCNIQQCLVGQSPDLSSSLIIELGNMQHTHTDAAFSGTSQRSLLIIYSISSSGST